MLLTCHWIRPQPFRFVLIIVVIHIKFYHLWFAIHLLFIIIHHFGMGVCAFKCNYIDSLAWNFVTRVETRLQNAKMKQFQMQNGFTQSTEPMTDAR